MDKAEKQKLSESDICDLFITPAIKQAGWDQFKQVRREVTLTPGPVIDRGNLPADTVSGKLLSRRSLRERISAKTSS